MRVLLLSGAMVIITAALSQAQDFYKGKTIRVIVGGSAAACVGNRFRLSDCLE